MENQTSARLSQLAQTRNRCKDRPFTDHRYTASKSAWRIDSWPRSPEIRNLYNGIYHISLVKNESQKVAANQTPQTTQARTVH